MAGSLQSNTSKFLEPNSRITPFTSHSNIILAFGLVTILATLLIRLTTPVLDIILAGSI